MGRKNPGRICTKYSGRKITYANFRLFHRLSSSSYNTLALPYSLLALVMTLFSLPAQCATWASTSTPKPPWRLMSPKPCRAASTCFDRSGPSDDLSRARFSSRWSCHWCRLNFTTAMRPLLVCLVMSWTDSSQSWMLQHGSYSQGRSTIM